MFFQCPSNGPTSAGPAKAGDAPSETNTVRTTATAEAFARELIDDTFHALLQGYRTEFDHRHR
jgi:hypothetical protein